MRRVLRCSGQMWRWRTALSMVFMLVAASVVCAAPTVTYTTPAESSSVSLGTKIQAAFSEPVDASLVDTRHITLSKKLKIVAIAAGPSHALAVRNDGTVASWRYSAGFTDERDKIPAGLTGVTAVAAGDYHSLALKSDGTVVAWGKNANGQCNVPANLSGVVAIAAGSDFSVALKNDGTVVLWGRGTLPAGLSSEIRAISAYGSFLLALKKDGSVIGWGFDGYRPGAIPALSGVAGIAQGYWHGLAVKCDGTVQGWGDNTYGERVAPAGLTDVKAVAAGYYFSLALKGDGTVVAWGKDSSNLALSVVPSDLKNVVAIAAGDNYSIALKNDSTVAGWGGVSSKNFPPVSPLIPDEPSEVTAVAQGGSFGVVLRRDGTVAVWGNTSSGQGNIPAGVSGVKAIAAGFYHALAVKGDGSLAAWGGNIYGQGTVPARLYGVKIKAVAAGESHSVVLKSDGTVDAWGLNNAGQCTIPSTVSGGVVAIAAGRYFTAALKSDGSVVVWGSNSNGQSTVPDRAKSNVKAIAAGYYHMLALKTDGTVVGWGQNSYGQAADQAGKFIDIAATENNSAALRTDGTVYAWGSEASSSTFMPAGLNGVRKLSGNAGNIAALKSNNTVVSWGAGNYGQSEVTNPYRNANIYESMVTGEVVYDDATSTATFTPSSPLEAAGYVAEATFIGNAAGEMLAAPALLSFSTIGFQPPELLTLAGSPFCPGSATYKVTGTVTGNTGGTISCTSPVSSGASAKCTMANNSGYQLTALTDNGSSVLTQVSNNVYTILNVQADHAVVATYTDIADPVITAPSDKYFEGTGLTTHIVAAMIGTATASDNSGAVVATSDFTEGDYRVGSYKVTWTARDAAGRSATATQTVTVGDKTAPAVFVPDNRVVEATSSAGAQVYFIVSATDIVDPAPIVDCSKPSGFTFPLGETIVTCTAKDFSNNYSVPKSFTITVQDTTAPQITPPKNVAIEATGPLTHITESMLGRPTVSDAVGDITITNNFKEGDYSLTDIISVIWYAEDSAHNRTPSTPQTVTLVDTTAPVLSVPDNKVVEATSPQGAQVFFTASATDAVDSAPAIDCSKPSGYTFPLGDTIVTCTAKDFSNNSSASKSFTITVQDTTAPVLTVPAPIVKEATSRDGAVVQFTVTAVDLVDPNPSVVCTPQSGSTFRLGETIVTCTATDVKTNSATQTFIVKVEDTTDPIITVPADKVVEATGVNTRIDDIGQATATDIFAVSISNNAPADKLYPVGTKLVTWTATDENKRSASGDQHITVQDTTAPVVTSPSNRFIEATGPLTRVTRDMIGVASATDAVGVTSISSNFTDGEYPLGTISVTWSAKDAAGNTGTAAQQQYVTVRDTTPPVLTVPKDINVVVKTPLSDAAVQAFLNGATATDAVSLPVTITSTTPDLSTVGPKVVTFTATDAAGNPVSGTATIHVVYGCGDTYLNNEATNYLTPVNLLKPFKLGSTVPVKLHLCDANGVDVTSAKAEIFVQLFNNNEPVGDPIEPTSTSGADTENFFRVAGNMYMYNLNTKSLNMGSYQIQAVLDDGTTRTIPLGLKQ